MIEKEELEKLKEQKFLKKKGGRILKYIIEQVFRRSKKTDQQWSDYGAWDNWDRS